MRPLPVSCALCGAPVQRARHLPTWLREFRAVYTELYSWHDARLSGFGKRRRTVDVIPLDSQITADVTDYIVPDYTDLVMIELMRSAFSNADGSIPEMGIVPSSRHSPLWGYAFHYWCWEILLISYSTSRPGKRIDVQAVFDVCRSHPIQGGAINWGHDYGGLRVLSARDKGQRFPGEEHWLHPDTLIGDEYTEDPMDIPQLRDIFDFDDDETLAEISRLDQMTTLRVSDSPSLFSLLPTEILADIFLYLDAKDVLNFKLASRHAANVRLSPRFWKSRFLHGGELSWAFEASSNLSSSRPWKAFYLKVKELHYLASIGNRKRVWDLTHNLCQMVDQRVASRACCGTPCPTTMELEGTKYNANWNKATSDTAASSMLFHQGSRALFERRIVLPQLPFKIFVSFSRIYRGRYVSGIRFVTRNGPAIILGYTHEDQEQVIWEEDPQEVSSIAGFDVAADNRGMRGLRVLYTSGVPSRWVGEPGGAFKRRLIPLSYEPEIVFRSLTHLKAEFDALKLVSLSVTDGLIFGVNREDRRLEPLLTDNYWYPEIPSSHLNLIQNPSRRISSRRYSLPCSVAIFGGDYGQYLPYMNKITFWTWEYTTADIRGTHPRIFGIQFDYSQNPEGQGPMFLGKIPDPERRGRVDKVNKHEVYIDSENGERLTGLETITEALPTYMFGVRLQTNSDRTIVIPPSCTEALPDDYYVYDSLVPKRGLPVGIFAALQSEGGVQDLGLACNDTL